MYLDGNNDKVEGSDLRDKMITYMAWGNKGTIGYLEYGTWLRSKAISGSFSLGLY